MVVPFRFKGSCHRWAVAGVPTPWRAAMSRIAAAREVRGARWWSGGHLDGAVALYVGGSEEDPYEHRQIQATRPTW